MPFLEGIGKFLADQWLKMSYIKQGKKEQLLDDIEQKEKNSAEAAKLKASVDGLSDDDLTELLRGGRKPKTDSNHRD